MPPYRLYQCTLCILLVCLLVSLIIVFLTACPSPKEPIYIPPTSAPTLPMPSVSPPLSTTTTPSSVPASTSTPPPTTPAPPVNKPPVLETIGDRNVPQASLLEFTVKATDPENDALTYAAANLPPKATFNKSTQVFSFTPDTVGVFKNVTFTVSDGLNIDSESISISAVQAVPKLLSNLPKTNMPLAVIYYGYATAPAIASILGVRPQYFISNTAHGLWGEMSGHGQNIFQDIAPFKQAGTKVIGYITAGYEGKSSGGRIDAKWYSLETNKKLIQDMAEIDGVDGVFIDECSDFPKEKDKAYLKELTTLAHSYNLITWGNVGMSNFDPLYFTDGGFDMVHANENWRAQNISKVQTDWGYRISVTGFNSKYTAQDAYNLTVNAWRKGLAYCYITNTSLGYNSLPPWLSEYADLLKQYVLSPEKYQPPPEKGNTTGIVASTPVSGHNGEYNLTLKITGTTVPGLSSGEQVWCAASITDFPDLLTVGATLTGDLDFTPGWWVFKKVN